MRKRLARELSKLGKSIARVVSAQDEQRNYVNDIEELINLWAVRNKERIENDLRALYNLGARFIKKAVEGNVDLDKINLLAIRRVEGLKTFGSTAINESIGNTTFNRVQKIISDGIFDGDSFQTMGQKILDQIDSGVFSIKRAELIAINTVGNAYEQGRKESMEQLREQGFVYQKRRDTVGDDRVTPECRLNESKGWIEYNEVRPSGDTEAPRHTNPRCRCTTNYRIL